METSLVCIVWTYTTTTNAIERYDVVMYVRISTETEKLQNAQTSQTIQYSIISSVYYTSSVATASTHIVHTRAWWCMRFRSPAANQHSKTYTHTYMDSRHSERWRYANKRNHGAPNSGRCARRSDLGSSESAHTDGLFRMRPFDLHGYVRSSRLCEYACRTTCLPTDIRIRRRWIWCTYVLEQVLSLTQPFYIGSESNNYRLSKHTLTHLIRLHMPRATFAVLRLCDRRRRRRRYRRTVFILLLLVAAVVVVGVPMKWSIRWRHRCTAVAAVRRRRTRRAERWRRGTSSDRFTAAFVAYDDLQTIAWTNTLQQNMESVQINNLIIHIHEQ